MKNKNDGVTKRIDDKMIDLVAQYDDKFFPDDRKAFIKNWITQEEMIGIVLINNGSTDSAEMEVKGKMIMFNKM